MTSRTAPTAATTVADRVVAVGDVVNYVGSIEAAHGPATVVAITRTAEFPHERGLVQFTITPHNGAGTLRCVRPRSIEAA